MLDLNHLTTPTTGRTDYFYGKSFALPGAWGYWEIWEKPRGINMINITCIGSGGGGGGGASNNSTTARGGGAGGSSGGFTSLLIPAIFLPDILYISVDGGGKGGAPGNPASLGTAGVGSYVSIAPYTTPTPIYTVCYAPGGTVSTVPASSTATSTAPGLVGAATISNMLIAGLGNFSALAGQVGGAGGIFNNGAGGAVAYPITGLLLSGGAGGGGGGSTVAAAGGAIAGGATTNPAQPSYVYFSGLIGGTTGNPALDGRSGYQIQQPLLSLGASGGGAGSANNATGGNGRPGGIGCGGSGGGGGNPGGTGGDGGPGLVIIQSW